MRKGFSLFTPLVGTAVIILAVMMTSIMVLNDLRMARGLMSSYEYSSEANAGALIKAAAQLKTLQNIEDTMDKYFNDTFSFSCPGSQKCENKVNNWVKPSENKMMGSTGKLAKKILLGYGGLYSGVLDNLETVTDYTIQNKAQKGMAISNSLNTYSTTGELMKVEWNRNKPKVEFTTNFQDDSFSVTFEKDDNTLTVSILPSNGLTYIYDKDIKNKFTQSAENFDTFVENVESEADKTWWRSNKNDLRNSPNNLHTATVKLTPVYDYNDLGACTTISPPHGTIVDSDSCNDRKPIAFFVTYEFTNFISGSKTMVIKYDNYPSGVSTINGKTYTIY